MYVWLEAMDSMAEGSTAQGKLQSDIFAHFFAKCLLDAFPIHVLF